MKTARIKKWLDKNRYYQIDIANELKVSPTLVCYTVHGKARNRRVLQWLLDHGCPERYLDFPRKRAA